MLMRRAAVRGSVRFSSTSPRQSVPCAVVLSCSREREFELPDFIRAAVDEAAQQAVANTEVVAKLCKAVRSRSVKTAAVLLCNVDSVPVRVQSAVLQQLCPDDLSWLLFVGCEAGIAVEALAQATDPNVMMKWGVGGHVLAPLHVAARNGHADVCKALLDCGADANVMTKGGRTPLASAVGVGARDVAAILLEHGAIKGLVPTAIRSKLRDDVLVYGSSEYIPANDATKEALKALDGGEKERLFKRAVWNGFADELEILLSLGVSHDVGRWYGNSETALQVALRKGHTATSTALVQHGARHAVTTQADGTAATATEVVSSDPASTEPEPVEASVPSSTGRFIVWSKIPRPIASFYEVGGSLVRRLLRALSGGKIT